MNTQKLTDILADPAAVAELRQCTSVAELVACLNRRGASCTREEGLRLLRAWERLDPDDETVQEPAPEKSGWLLRFGRALFGHSTAHRPANAHRARTRPVTIDLILEQMNRASNVSGKPALPGRRQP